MFIKVENKDKYRSAEDFYWHIRSNDHDYLFTSTQLSEASKRAVKNREDIPKPKKSLPSFWKGFFFGTLATTAGIIIRYFMFKELF